MLDVKLTKSGDELLLALRYSTNVSNPFNGIGAPVLLEPEATF